MVSRFLISLMTAFLVTLTTLAGAGYGVTLISVAPPRDVFRTSYFEFEIAPGWECGLDGTEHVCQAKGNKQKGAIAVIAMKERGPATMDSLDAYEQHLRKPQTLAAKTGANDPLSVIKRVGRIQLGGTEWVEALHFGSELAGFYTYYLGTVSSHVGILVTMSYREGQEAIYERDLTDMMGTVRIYQQ